MRDLSSTLQDISCGEQPATGSVDQAGWKGRIMAVTPKPLDGSSGDRASDAMPKASAGHPRAKAAPPPSADLLEVLKLLRKGHASKLRKLLKDRSVHPSSRLKCHDLTALVDASAGMQHHPDDGSGPASRSITMAKNPGGWSLLAMACAFGTPSCVEVSCR
jgi:hypothetical protein